MDDQAHDQFLRVLELRAFPIYSFLHSYSPEQLKEEDLRSFRLDISPLHHSELRSFRIRPEEKLRGLLDLTVERIQVNY